jgi:hypothetical protein
MIPTTEVAASSATARCSAHETIPSRVASPFWTVISISKPLSLAFRIALAMAFAKV